MLVSPLNQATNTREKSSQTNSDSQVLLDRLLNDPKVDPKLYVALMKDCDPNVVSSEDAAKIGAKQFTLNVLTILKGSDSAMKERLNRLLPALFNTIFDEDTSKVIAKQLTTNTSLVNREIHRVEEERNNLKNLSASQSVIIRELPITPSANKSVIVAV